jgi:hypothetical protein
MHHQDPTDPTGVSGDGPRDNTNIVRARNRKANAAVQLRIAGASWAEIAETLGYPTPRAALVATEKALEKEMKTEESQTHMRSLAGKRLERVLRSVWAKAIDPSHPEHLLAVDRVRLLIDRHAKLYGLDAPQQFVVNSPTQIELEQWVATVVQQGRPALEEGDIFDVDWEESDDDDGPEPLAIGAS